MQRSYRLLGAVLLAFVAGCDRQDNTKTTSEQAQASSQQAYGRESFVVCTKFQDGPVGFAGGYTVVGKQMAQGAVIVVAAKEGIEIAGLRFPYRQVVLVDEKNGVPVPRFATPTDVVVLDQDTTIFGKSYSKGKLSLPEDGKLASGTDPRKGS